MQRGSMRRPRRSRSPSARRPSEVLAARFLVWDALALADLNEQFDTVLDSGLFHVFDDDRRAKYVSSLAAVVRPGGHVLLACFSDRQPGDWGPRPACDRQSCEMPSRHDWDIQFLVSGTVRDLVVGSGIEFADRGEHELEGCPGPGNCSLWRTDARTAMCRYRVGSGYPQPRTDDAASIVVLAANWDS